MKISKQARRDAKAFFRVAQVDGLLDENRMRQIVDNVMAKKPRGYIAILSHLLRLIKLDEARRSAKIESATPLLPDVESKLKTTLELRYGKGLRFSFVENPALIGGTRVQVGSDVYDGSVRARLNDLEESFKAA
ncbi:MAG: F0F1 ATP synthase subunit delta [Verrucomicrobiota bacterium]